MTQRVEINYTNPDGNSIVFKMSYGDYVTSEEIANDIKRVIDTTNKEKIDESSRILTEDM